MDCDVCIFSFCYGLLFFISIPIAFLLLFVILYFSFAAIMQLSIYTFIYSWLSLFSKSAVHVILSILVNFSDFGYYFYLLLFVVFLIMDFFPFLQDKVPEFFKVFGHLTEEMGDCCAGFILFPITLLFLGFGCLFAYCIINQRRLSIAAFFFACFLLFAFFIIEILFAISYSIDKDKEELSLSENTDNTSQNTEKTNDDGNDEEENNENEEKKRKQKR